MPLPADTALSLLGYSHPGNPVQPKPKLAMIVRMSVETLDALETFPNQPTMDFEFGDVPGIHIGDQFFAMRPLQENMHHELYLRASSATKKTAPLKHYANVVGKFTIERKLDDDVRDKIRESTQDAVHQRTSRHTILIEPPTDVQAKKKKEPHPGMFRKPLRPSDKSKTNSLPLPSPHTANKSLATPSSSPSVPLRKRIVHCLAVSERTEDQLLRLVGGPGCSPSSRQEIHDLLGELADQISPGKGPSDKPTKVYRLKPQAWKEVRPYEWPKLTEAERTAMARGARCAFKDLGIPETDSAWTHVLYRTSGTTMPTSSTPSSSSDTLTSLSSMDDKAPPQHQEVAKRGLTSREIKEKKTKAKAKPDPKPDILMKDESANGASRADQHNSASSRILSEYSHSSDVISMSRKSASSAPHVRSSDQQRRDSNASQQGAAPTKSKQTPQSVVNSILRTSISSEKERRVISQGSKNTQEHLPKIVNPNRQARSDKSREKVGVRTGREESDNGASHLLLKRKIGTRDTDDEHLQPGSRSGPPKRHKTDPPVVNISRTTAQDDKGSASSSRVQRGGHMREYAIVDNSKRSASTSDNSPLLSQHAPRKSSSERIRPPQFSLSCSSNINKLSGTPKNRRAPIYTSSEDDDEPLQQQAQQGVLLSASKGITISESFASNSTTAARTRIRNNSSRTLPTDHVSLRARYNASYLQYLAMFQKLVVQKGKIDKLLGDGGMGGAGSITESEADAELLDPDELGRLASDHKRLHEELETIQRIFGGLCSSD